MVNETSLVDNLDLNQAKDVLTTTSQTITEKIVELLANYGFVVSVRWASLLVLFISFAIIFIGLKISKPAIKWILVILGIFLIASLLIPW